ncbi:MAG: tryptophan synthase subunit alpha [Gemmatimonadetes bacterium]|nr:tryptophan synthase subunit alpha [Gemmatimonadota bacterium]
MISAVFAARRSEGRATLVPYFTAGHPDADSTATVLSALTDAGADVIELGIPFSDPLADGPTIQKSSFESLKSGTTVARVLRDLSVFREAHQTPVVLFTYLNPVLRYGIDGFLSDAVEAGANGLLLTDLPTGADPELEAKVVASQLDLIRLIAPTTQLNRVRQVSEGGSGFVYYISRTGVTGARQELRGELHDEIRAIQGTVDLPVAVGFGISTPEQAAAVGDVADGVVVGSALVQRLGAEGVDAGAAFVRSLREGLDSGR